MGADLAYLSFIMRVFLVSALLFCVASAHLSTIFDANDQSRVKGSLKLFKSDSAKDLFFAASSLALLGDTLPNKDAACRIAAQALESKTAEQIYYGAELSEVLDCPNKNYKTAVESIKTLLKEKSVRSVAFAAAAAALFKEKKRTAESFDMSSVVSALQAAVEQDGVKDVADAVPSFELSGKVLETLGAAGDKKSHSMSLEKAKSLFAAVEGDENVLYFVEEDGQRNLHATSAMLRGLNRLAGNSSLDFVTASQVSALASTLLRAKHSTQPEDIYAVIAGLKATVSGLPTPVAVTVEDNAVVSLASNKPVQIRVSDAFGNHVAPATVTLLKASVKGQTKAAALASNQELKAVSGDASNTLYSLDLLSSKPLPGPYNLELKVHPKGASSRKVESVESAVRSVRVVASIQVSDVEVVVSNKDGTGSNKHTIKYGSSKTISAAVKQIVVATFKVAVAGQTQAFKPQQVFAKIRHTPSDSFSYVVAKASDKGYKLTLELGSADQIPAYQGQFDIELLVGDSNILNPISWKLIQLTLTGDNLKTKSATAALTTAKAPEIEHQFRPSEKRPASLISLAFSGMVLIPFVLLLLGLLTSRVNLGLFPTSGLGFLTALAFQILIGAIFSLFALFWLQLNLFQTLAGLAALAIPTLLIGNKALCDVANAKTKTE
eukprot:GILJ01003029.1.p1 GENE.GILJ01003029.1~~GILJ01003029.1.p1  ORF type:complete len:664 (+),score=146.33 GILJ01003029.1:1-1992(+)